jgi:predicted DCC family thiol-disulfide oxidoreductase YuxK
LKAQIYTLVQKTPDPSSLSGRSIIFFDGVCNLCNGSVQFVLKHDKAQHFYFATLQSDFARKVFHDKLYLVEAPASILLVEGGKVYVESTAALKICRRLNGLWPLLYGFVIVPPFIRDRVYRLISNNRYKWFGKMESCMLPQAGWKERFLDAA